MKFGRAQRHAGEHGAAFAILEAAHDRQRDRSEQPGAQPRRHHVLADASDALNRVVIRMALGELRVQRPPASYCDFPGLEDSDRFFLARHLPQLAAGIFRRDGFLQFALQAPG